MMGCGCENKKIMSDYERVAMLAKKLPCWTDACTLCTGRVTVPIRSTRKVPRWMALLLNINIICDGKFKIEGLRR